MVRTDQGLFMGINEPITIYAQVCTDVGQGLGICSYVYSHLASHLCTTVPSFPHWVVSSSQAEVRHHDFSLVTVPWDFMLHGGVVQTVMSCTSKKSRVVRPHHSPHPLFFRDVFLIIREPKRPESRRLKTMWIHSSLVQKVRSLR